MMKSFLWATFFTFSLQISLICCDNIFPHVRSIFHLKEHKIKQVEDNTYNKFQHFLISPFPFFPLLMSNSNSSKVEKRFNMWENIITPNEYKNIIIIWSEKMGKWLLKKKFPFYPWKIIHDRLIVNKRKRRKMVKIFLFPHSPSKRHAIKQVRIILWKISIIFISYHFISFHFSSKRHTTNQIK